jgi:hypothetical protein
MLTRSNILNTFLIRTLECQELSMKRGWSLLGQSTLISSYTASTWLT